MVTAPSSLVDAVARKGFAVIENFVSNEVVEQLLYALANDLPSDRAGTRQLHRMVPAIAEFLQSEQLKEWVDELIPGGFPVRTILFDKTPERNWHVAWHQDLSICVKDRHDVPGFSAWSMKEGVHHVQPPMALLERMLTVRLQLDHCGEHNGPLRVIPGSHGEGRLSPDRIAEWRDNGPIKTCVVSRGGAVIMKPLLLHSSSPAINPSHRRVLHIEFASDPLPRPLEWVS